MQPTLEADRCAELAVRLIDAADPALSLPSSLPCPPGVLMRVLHRHVVQAMHSDLSHAQRAAAATWVVAQRFPEDAHLRAQAHWSQASAVLRLPDYMQALAHYDQALACYDQLDLDDRREPPQPDVRVVHAARLACLLELGRYQEAERAVTHAEQWLASYPDHPMHQQVRLTLLVNQSMLAGHTGRFTQMLDYTSTLVAYATELGQPRYRAMGWINQAYALTYLGHFTEAEHALEQGLGAARLADDVLNVARAQWNQARLLRCQGRLFEALTALEAARRGFAQAPHEAGPFARDQALVLRQLHQLPEALRAARFSAEQCAQQGLPTYSVAAALEGVRIAVQLGLHGPARTLLHIAERQATELRLPLLDADIALARASLGLLPAPGAGPPPRRRLQQARVAANRALAVFQQHVMKEEIVTSMLTLAALDRQLDNLSAAREGYQQLLDHPNQATQLAAHAGLGALLPAGAALPYLQRAAALATEQRRSLPMEELQARYNRETSFHHMELMACHLTLNMTTVALESAWTAKAGSLLDLRTSAASLEGELAGTLEHEKAVLASWRSLADDCRMEAQRAALAGQARRAEAELQRAQDAEAQAHRQAEAIMALLRTRGDRLGQAGVPAVADVQQALEPGMAILEYVQRGDELGCFLLCSDAAPTYRRLPAATLQRCLDHWTLALQRLLQQHQHTCAVEIMQQALQPLWTILVEPWQHELTTVSQLLIAPYGALHQLPWAALWDGAAYLQDRFAVMVTPAGALWGSRIANCQPPGPPLLLCCQGRGARQLRYTAQELRSIEQCFLDAQLIEEARIADIYTARPPHFLHIAAHAQANPTAPLCSSLELADGPLLVLEAHRLNLRGSELVTLSACETSVYPERGDMSLALAGAFLCAGARAVLASLWPVDDAATAQLMQRFYAHLAAGLAPALALRLAQQQIRDHYPLDWPAFQLWSGTSCR